MDLAFILRLPLLIVFITFDSARSSVDRYITELPSNLDWDYGMVADQPYSIAASRPTSYTNIYQIEDLNANYIYSTDYWAKKDYLSYTKPKLLDGPLRSGDKYSAKSHRSSPKFQYRSDIVSALLVPLPRSSTPPPLPSSLAPPVVTWYGPFLRSYYATPTYPFAYRDVYITPYEFNTFVQPSVLYSTYPTYTYTSEPVGVVNNNFNGLPLHTYIYENPKQHAYTYHTLQQPALVNASKIYNDRFDASFSTKPAKKPIQTNLTKINIDPITEPRFFFRARAATNNRIIHKQRATLSNHYAPIYHKLSFR